MLMCKLITKYESLQIWGLKESRLWKQMIEFGGNFTVCAFRVASSVSHFNFNSVNKQSRQRKPPVYNEPTDGFRRSVSENQESLVQSFLTGFQNPCKSFFLALSRVSFRRFNCQPTYSPRSSEPLSLSRTDNSRQTWALTNGHGPGISTFPFWSNYLLP